VESFGSFFSGALKDVIVFSLLIPVLLMRSALVKHAEEEQEEIEA
jgi:branched-chain amino acid transport system permease protein